MPKAHLDFQASHVLGNLQIDCSFILSTPWTVLFGPSGSGKSSILKIIAGLMKPVRGKILLQSETVLHTARSVFIPASQRPIRWTGQQAALFPHRTIESNLRFAFQQSPARNDTLARGVHHFGLDPILRKLPRELSGGEQQRVAVVRAALCAQGKTLLLDEPFTGLDFQVRDTLIEALKTWLPRTPIVSVTHSVEEAFMLNAWIVKINQGQVVAQGYPGDVLSAERDSLRKNLA